MPPNIFYPYEYRLDPMLRRCCWYWITSTPIILFALYLTGQGVKHAHDKDFILVFLMGVFIMLAGLVMMPLFWKIRLDDNGISRYSFFRWTFWSWNDIASGRIQKYGSQLLYNPSQPFGRRSLLLSYLSHLDYQEVMVAINEHYQLPLPPYIPETVTVSLPFQHIATFDQTGIHRVVRKKKQDVLWEDVCDVHITRMEPQCRDFTQIVITLPDQKYGTNEIVIRQSMVPEPEELNELLHEEVSPDKMHVSIVGQPLTKQIHIERRLKIVEKNKQEMPIVVLIIITPFMIGLLILMVHGADLWKVWILGLLMPLKVVVIFGITYRTHCKEIRELEKNLADKI